MLASEIVRSLNLGEIIRAEGSTCLAEFAETLEKSPDTSIETFLSTRPKQDRSQLTALIAIELRHCWERRKPCFIEAYFQRFPELLKNREQVLDLIYAEYCERRQLQEAFESEEYYERFPDLQDSLERLFQIDSLFEGAPDAIDQAAGKTLNLPDAGDEFLDFRLLAELGRGAFGRVFLAEQTSLSDRRVVVKITPLRTIEHQTLARLDHPNIVPVHSVHRDELSELQAVCMPYQCAVALSDVHTTWRDTGLVPATADVFVQALQHLVPVELRKTEEQNGKSRFPARQSYVYACSWIMQKLAAALHHAHIRGIYHRDLKPSNILLTMAGQPLLVDFNLAFNKEESGGDTRAFFGGTLPYMPPEQIQVLHPAEEGRADDVGPRSDIYSLAATVFELLTGRLPFEPPKPGEERLMALRGQLEQRYAGVPSARAFNPNVPQDFDALLTKCLDPASYQRYETAAQLAEDLERFLRERTLRHIGKIALRHALIKFIRRNRRALFAGATLAASALVVAGSFYLTQLNAERERLAKEKALQDTELAEQRAELAQQQADREREGRAEAETYAEEAWTNAHAEVEREKELVRTQVEKDLEQLGGGFDREKERITKLRIEYARKGKENYFRRRYPVAVIWFNEAENLGYKHWPMMYYYRARCLAPFDRDEQALRDFNEAIALQPGFAHAYLHRAICYATSKQLLDPSKALEDLEKAISLRPPDIDEGVSAFMHDVARAYGAIHRNYPDDRALPLSKEESLRKACEYLFKAVELGFPPRSIRELHATDRFKMLEHVLSQEQVQEFLKQHEKGESSEPP